MAHHPDPLDERVCAADQATSEFRPIHIRWAAQCEHQGMNRHVPLLFLCAVTVAISGLAVSRGFATDDPLPASEPSSSGRTGAAAATSGATGATVPIKIVDFAFDPESTTIAAGSTVVWTNDDSAAHSVRSNDGKFAEQTMKSGATATATFSQAGTYSYICGIHPFMTATIVAS